MSGPFREEKNIFHFSRNRSSHRPPRILVTILTGISDYTHISMLWTQMLHSLKVSKNITGGFILAYIKPWRKKVKVHFSTYCFRMSVFFFLSFPCLPLFRSGKNNACMKMNMERWRNRTDSETNLSHCYLGHHKSDIKRAGVKTGRWITASAMARSKPDRQCTYYVTLRRFHESNVAVEKQYYIFVCVRACVRVGSQALACGCARTALIIQHATRRHIPICGLSGSTNIFDIIS
jgi:hypothetical protein